MKDVFQTLIDLENIWIDEGCTVIYTYLYLQYLIFGG